MDQMLSRLVAASALVLKHGPRTVLLARGAKRRGALQKKGELRPFISFLRGQELRTVVEIGTYRGGTLWLWCQLAKANAKIVSIDLPGGAFGGGYDKAEAEGLRKFARPGQELRLLAADSHDPRTLQQVKEILGSAPIDMLFIDGDHTYEGVRRDYEMYAPLVRRGGVVAFHDVLPHTDAADCEVDVYWNELKGHVPRHFEFTEAAASAGQPQWGGIGAILVT
jgi:predicted O-methyltransferase YrrM